MTTPAPRAGTNQAGGNKGGGAGPCGPQNAATPQVTLAAGAQTTVEWDINAAHGGSCEIKVAPTDGELEAATAIGGNFPCGANGQATTRTVTIPADTAAGTAVLQWYWTGDGPYWNCADVTITGGGGGAAAALRPAAQASTPTTMKTGGRGARLRRWCSFLSLLAVSPAGCSRKRPAPAAAPSRRQSRAYQRSPTRRRRPSRREGRCPRARCHRARGLDSQGVWTVSYSRVLLFLSNKPRAHSGHSHPLQHRALHSINQALRRD